MEIVAPHASVIVPEVLKSNNYKRWSIFMRHYLVGQDLWDVVQLSQLPTGGNMKEWIKKSALALHAIKISCGEEMFDKIKDMDSAKDVWDTLVEMHKPPIVSQESAGHPLERRTGPGNLASSQYETLIKAISNGERPEVQNFFKEENRNSNAKSARIFENGYTALHFAVYNGKEEIVNYLIESSLSREELEIKDDFGSTALSIAARCGVKKSIAQSLIRMNHNLLTIPDNDAKIPVQLACSTIQEDMTRYLYRETPLESLNVDRGFYILQECITRKMFDIVFDLLHHFPKLASHSCTSDSIPLILTLAQTPPPFFRGSNLSFWGRWIYDCIRVKAYIIKEEKDRSCVEKIQDFFKTSVQKTTASFQSCGAIVQHCFLSSGIGVFLLRIVIFFVVGIPFEVLVMSVSLIGLAIVITLSMPLILDTQYYQLKLMDKYAREVIRLICHQSLSELDQNQFVQSRAVEATFYAIKNGIPDIVEEITKTNANILWSSTDPEDSRSIIQNIFACSVAHRQERVAHLLYESEKEKTCFLPSMKMEIIHLFTP